MKRTQQQLRNHYEIEKRIATQLKKANRSERKAIYSTMYEELFEKVPDHPRLQIRDNSRLSTISNKNKYDLVSKFITKDSLFVEFAPGDCNLPGI